MLIGPVLFEHGDHGRPNPLAFDAGIDGSSNVRGDHDIAQTCTELVNNQGAFLEQTGRDTSAVQARNQQSREREKHQRCVHSPVNRSGQQDMEAVRRVMGPVEGRNTTHVGKPKHNNEKKNKGKDGFKQQQATVFQLAQVVQLFEDAIGIERDERPVNETSEQRVRPIHVDIMAKRRT